MQNVVLLVESRPYYNRTSNEVSNPPNQFNGTFIAHTRACSDFFLGNDWRAESARAWISKILGKSTSVKQLKRGNAEPYVR